MVRRRRAAAGTGPTARRGRWLYHLDPPEVHVHVAAAVLGHRLLREPDGVPPDRTAPAARRAGNHVPGQQLSPAPRRGLRGPAPGPFPASAAAAWLPGSAAGAAEQRN